MSGQSKRIPVRWEGAQFSWHSLAHVNRELCLGLSDIDCVDLSLLPTDVPQFGPEEDPRFQRIAERVGTKLSAPAKVHVRHRFPPVFDRPAEGLFALIQPWEYGFLPMHWIGPIANHVHEVWCYSQYVRDVYIASGIPAEKLHIVPLGVDTCVFNPNAPPYILTMEAGAERIRDDVNGMFVFLYVGGTLHRKGVDILLDAYLSAFSPSDDVCLLIKDT